MSERPARPLTLSTIVALLRLMWGQRSLQILMLEGRRHAVDLGRGKAELLRHPAPRSNRLPHLRCDFMGLVLAQFEIAGDLERQLQRGGAVVQIDSGGQDARLRSEKRREWKWGR